MAKTKNELLLECRELLRDIVNAAANKEAYTPQELCKMCIPLVDAIDTNLNIIQD